MLTPEQLVGYLSAAMISWSPWHQHETRPDTRARYESIAYDAATVALEDAGRDAPWAKLVVSRGAFTDVPVAKTALLMLAISSYESGGFRPDVDSIEATGDCHEVVALPNGLRPVGLATENTVKRMVCRSRCLAQIQLRAGEVLRDRRDCFRLELARIRESYASCALPLIEGLAVYASGRCDRGTAASRKRVARAVEWWAVAPFLAPVDGV